MLKTFLDLHPTVLHDLHESVTLLYVSTGTGPYNPIVDPIQVNEWWLLAQTEIMEMTKRGVPGVWTYNYYDGWVPNYMFWIGVTHNSIGRFYETQSYGGARTVARRRRQSREWYRPNPDPDDIALEPRANVNMQQTALLIALNTVAKNKETFLENYYLKNKHMIERGKTHGALRLRHSREAAAQVEAAELMNLIRREGAEVHTRDAGVHGRQRRGRAPATTSSGSTSRTAASSRCCSACSSTRRTTRARTTTPAGRFRCCATSRCTRIDDKAILDKPMTLATADFKIAGHDHRHRQHDRHRPHDRQHAGDVPLPERRREDVGGRAGVRARRPPLRARRVRHRRTRTARRSSRRFEELGLPAWATDAPPTVPMHDLDVPRIGYIHTWTSTQDEGWVRLALDKFKVPYTYFGDNEVRQGNLRAKYDVIVYPQRGRAGRRRAAAPAGGTPQPYKKTRRDAEHRHGARSDRRQARRSRPRRPAGAREVRGGGRRAHHRRRDVARCSSSTGLTPGVDVEDTDGLYVPGSVLKTLLGDKTSPILYGYDQNALAV